MSAVTFDKDPADVLEYSFDWSIWLGATDLIASYTATPSPGITVNSEPFSTTATTAWLSGGTAGIPYEIKHKIVTRQGRVKNLTMTIRVTNE